MWLGGIVTLLLLSVAFRAPTSDGALAAVRSAMKLIDYGVIIPACFGSLLSGIGFMALTNWGFLKHRWVIIKWSATATMIVFGALCLGPWVDATAAMATDSGVSALARDEYTQTAGRVTIFAAVQLLLLVALVVLSSFKPWGRRS